MEVTEPADVVNKFYDELLTADPSNEAVWKRKISVLRRRGFVGAAVEELSEFLDTFYTDVEGWLELADIYSSCNQYTSALQALSHALLLNPQNPFYVLQAAETAYTIGDLPLAIKMFLMAVDMTDGTDGDFASSIPTGITVRAWYGVKLCSRRLMNEPRLAASSSSQTPAPKNINLVDQLATERVLAAYGSKSGSGRSAQNRFSAMEWLSAP
jgi:tetratricopeptide (TPR) repeat protein